MAIYLKSTEITLKNLHAGSEYYTQKKFPSVKCISSYDKCSATSSFWVKTKHDAKELEQGIDTTSRQGFSEKDVKHVANLSRKK